MRGAHQFGCVPRPQPEAHIGSELVADVGQTFVAEGADTHTVETVESSQHGQERLDGGVELGINVDPGMREGGEKVLEQRYWLPPADQDLSGLVVAHGLDGAGCVCEPVEGAVVEGEQYAVSRCVDICLEVPVAEINGVLERRHRILEQSIVGGVVCAAAMCERDRPRMVEKGMNRRHSSQYCVLDVTTGASGTTVPGMHPGIHAANSPDKVAYIMEPSGTAVTYGELETRSNQLAHLFRDVGLKRGDHVAFMLENHPLYFVLAWGAHRAGLYYTAISNRLGVAETAYIVDNCDAKVFITSNSLRAVAEEIVDETPKVKLRLMIGGTTPSHDSYEDTVATRPSTPIDDESEGTDMLYSSGTAGRPKGVMTSLPEGAFGSDMGLIPVASALYGLDENSMYLSPAPLYHAAPLRFCMAILRMGATVVSMQKFDAEEALGLIERHQITHSQWVPTMFVRMFKLDETTGAKFDLSSHQTAIHAAAPCPKEIKQALIEWWGPIVHEYYAGSEGNGFVQCNSDEWLAHPGTVGSALVGTIHICDDAGSEVGVGEEGTIYFEGGGTFEYHGDPDKTAEAQHADREGWSTLGDVGYLDEDGFLYLTDRKAFMIISGGVNIYPQEAENRLILHSSVMDAAVFGVPNDDFGEEVKAVVQPIDFADADDELGRELIAFCREELADIKCPRSVDFVEELPRHATGKLYKRVLKDQYWEGRAI